MYRLTASRILPLTRRIQSIGPAAATPSPTNAANLDLLSLGLQPRPHRHALGGGAHVANLHPNLHLSHPSMHLVHTLRSHVLLSRLPQRRAQLRSVDRIERERLVVLLGLGVEAH